MGGKQLRLWAALKLPNQHREPEEGDVETGRGKKVKKTAWHLTLKLKDVILAGIGVVGLMSMSFALGALAGRGDIYRAAYSWGLMNPEAKQAAQVMAPVAAVPVPPTAGTAPAPAAPSATPAAAPASPAVAPPAIPAATPAAAKPAHSSPITSSMTPLPAPSAAASSKKRSKAAQAQHNQKAREDRLRQERQDVAKKLTFQNSFDTATKPGHKKDKDKTKAALAKPPSAQVKVGTYRDSKTAKIKMAELQKKGVKVSLKQGKDDKGVCYTLYRQTPAAQPKESENLAQRKEKPGGAGPSRKPQPE